MVEECVKGTSRVCRRVSRWWKVPFMSLCAPKSPETWDSTKSLIHQLTEVIQAWRYWYANTAVQLQVCWSGLWIVAPFLIHFFFAHTMTLLSMPRVSVWLRWGSKHAWIRPDPDLGIDGQMSPLEIFTPIWKWLVTLTEEVKCPHSGRRGLSA